MLTVYLIALLVGGGLLGVTVFLGGHDHEAHVGEHAPGGDVALAWLPFTSLRFWTFFAAFFGLTGTALTAWRLVGPVPAAILASLAGYVSGLLVDRAVRSLSRAGSDSAVGAGDLVGAEVEVVLPIGAGRTGKVRAALKDRSVDLLAETDDGVELATGERVSVLAMRGDGHVVVTRGKLERER